MYESNTRKNNYIKNHKNTQYSTSIIRNNHVHTAKSYHCLFAWHCLHITEISRLFSVAHFPQVGLSHALQIVTVALVQATRKHTKTCFCAFSSFFRPMRLLQLFVIGCAFFGVPSNVLCSQFSNKLKYKIFS